MTLIAGDELRIYRMHGAMPPATPIIGPILPCKIPFVKNFLLKPELCT